MKTQTLASLAVVAALVSGAGQAQVLKQDTSLNVGYWMEMGSDSKASRQHDETNIILSHITVADWGEIAVKGKLENVIVTKDELNGSEGNIGFKAMASAYYNTGLTETQLWYDLFVVSNRKIAENHNYFGAAHKFKLGSLKGKIGVAADYLFGHTPSRDFEGFGGWVTKLKLAYPLVPNLTGFAMMEYRFDTDEGAMETWHWEDSGYHAVLGAKWRMGSDWDLKASYHKFDSWGGYNEGGNSLLVTVGYHF